MKLQRLILWQEPPGTKSQKDSMRCNVTQAKYHQKRKQGIHRNCSVAAILLEPLYVITETLGETESRVLFLIMIYMTFSS